MASAAIEDGAQRRVDHRVVLIEGIAKFTTHQGRTDAKTAEVITVTMEVTTIMQIVVTKIDALGVVAPIDENKAIRIEIMRVFATAIDAAGLRIAQETREVGPQKKISIRSRMLKRSWITQSLQLPRLLLIQSQIREKCRPRHKKPNWKQTFWKCSENVSDQSEC
ncbi:hypothetical protein KPH14_012619 [Odynerus spinipes]|uniref:Uncharacterized protein n=1 Tax=Odynerus spinipes TaxID=1348599 RepID=A0AAD9RDV9_9HYME|nr:hypothetical protein KPH14_012619 [Odynerus spinipes]